MRLFAAFLLLACMATAGCANNSDRPEQNRFDGFYGGMNGGAGMGP